MRQYLIGLDNTPSGAKFARERHLDENLGTIVVIGYHDLLGHYMDIIPAPPKSATPPQLRLVVNNG